MSALLALLSSLLWGASDYLGGTTARRMPVTQLLLVGQGCAFVLLVVLTAATGSWRWGDAIRWGLVAGAVGPLALAAFYTALSQGTMGVVAPVASCGVLVPVAVGLARGERPGVLAAAGIVVTLAGIALAARAVGVADARPDGRSVGLAVLAAMGFGAVLLCVAEGSSSSPLTMLTVQRGTNVLVVGSVLAVAAAHSTRPRFARSGPVLLTAAFVGVGDVTANSTYAYASRAGLVSVTSVLASLYPVVTVLLARHFSNERLSRAQAAGVATTIAGVIMLAVG